MQEVLFNENYKHHQHANFTSDGARILGSDGTGRLWIFNGVTGATLLWPLEIPWLAKYFSSNTQEIAWSPDSSKIAVAAEYDLVILEASFVSINSTVHNLVILLQLQRYS